MANISEYSRRLYSKNASIEKSQDIDSSIQQFTTIIKKSAVESTFPNGPRKHIRPKIPKFIQDLIIKKRSERRQWQLTRLPAMKTELNRLIREVKKQLHEY